MKNVAFSVLFLLAIAQNIFAGTPVQVTPDPWLPSTSHLYTITNQNNEEVVLEKIVISPHQPTEANTATIYTGATGTVHTISSEGEIIAVNTAFSPGEEKIISIDFKKAYSDITGDIRLVFRNTLTGEISIVSCYDCE
jgi:hypothetical protein